MLLRCCFYFWAYYHMIICLHSNMEVCWWNWPPPYPYQRVVLLCYFSYVVITLVINCNVTFMFGLLKESMRPPVTCMCFCCGLSRFYNIYIFSQFQCQLLCVNSLKHDESDDNDNYWVWLLLLIKVHGGYLLICLAFSFHFAHFNLPRMEGVIAHSGKTVHKTILTIYSLDREGQV